MLRYLGRNVETILKATRLDPVPLFDRCSTSLTVRNVDIDFESKAGPKRLNLGRVVEALEMGRTAYIVRSGFWRPFLNEKLAPIVAAITLDLHDANAQAKIAEHESMIATCQLGAWDDRFFVLEQTLTTPGRNTPLLSATIKAIAFRRGTRDVFTPVQFFRSMGLEPRQTGTVPVPPRTQIPELTAPVTRSDIVGVQDLDYNFHMNNSRFVYYLDQARQQVLLDRPVKSFSIDYVRPLHFRSRFQILSQLSASEADQGSVVLNQVMLLQPSSSATPTDERKRHSAHATTSFF